MPFLETIFTFLLLLLLSGFWLLTSIHFFPSVEPTNLFIHLFWCWGGGGGWFYLDRVWITILRRSTLIFPTQQMMISLNILACNVSDIVRLMISCTSLYWILQDFMSSKIVLCNIMAIFLPGVTSIIHDRTSQIYGQHLEKTVHLALEIIILVLGKDLVVADFWRPLYQVFFFPFVCHTPVSDGLVICS